MLSQFVFVLKIKIKEAFPLLVYKSFELLLGHLCYCLTDVPPNSPPDYVSRVDSP